MKENILAENLACWPECNSRVIIWNCFFHSHNSHSAVSPLAEEEESSVRVNKKRQHHFVLFSGPLEFHMIEAKASFSDESS